MENIIAIFGILFFLSVLVIVVMSMLKVVNDFFDPPKNTLGQTYKNNFLNIP